MKQYLPAIRAVARYTALEALRTRYGWLLLLVSLSGFGLVAFAGQLAITESGQIQATLTAAVLRLGTVFLLALFIITSVQRDFSDKSVDIMLSLALPRTGYYLGKLAGYALIAAFTALPVMCLIVFLAPFPQSLLWSLSLFLELLIVCAASLVFAFSFTQVTAAIGAFSGFYLLSRSIAAMQLMSKSPLIDEGSLSTQVIRQLVNGLAYLLPDLDRFTCSDWLIYAEPAGQQLALLSAQTCIYLLLLSAVALFDLQRKNF